MIKSGLALIFCGDCQKEYSDYALACPVCARPTDTQVINDSYDESLNLNNLIARSEIKDDIGKELDHFQKKAKKKEKKNQSFKKENSGEFTFEKATEKYIKVIMLAQEEARRLGHNFVGTEQILLGLISERTGVAAKVLKSSGINLKDSRLEVEKIIGRGSGFVAEEIPFTPRAKRVLELSLKEARQLGHNYIDTEHLLLGLIREGECVAARVLENLEIDLTKVRSQVISRFDETAEIVKGEEVKKVAEVKKKLEAKKVSQYTKSKAKDYVFSRSKISILLIEDDRDMRDLLARHLEHSGFDVQKAVDGIKGQALALQYSPDLILLDLMLPSVDGLSLCQRLRRDKRTSNIPILMITALGGLEDKVTGFNSLAVDYITKPFDLEELHVRIKVLLRRSNRTELNSSNQQEILNYGPLTLVPERFEAIWFESPVRLTHLEFELLHCLLQRHGQTVSPALILKEVWGYEPDDDIEIIRVHVRHLRTKLEPDPRKPTYIKTVYGAGYCFNLPSKF